LIKFSLGFFTKPIKGASQKGIKGFLKGSYQAMAGILVKPISGLLDAASKTAEGIKNMSDDRSRKSNSRVRPPRIFYGKYRVYKTYFENDAIVIEFLYKNISFAVESKAYIGSFPLASSKQNPQEISILAVFEEGITLLNQKMEANGLLEFKEIKAIDHVEQGLKISLAKGAIYVPNWNDDLNRAICNLLNEIMM